MEYRTGEESGETANRTEESKGDGEKIYFGADTENNEYNNTHMKNGTVAPKPGDVRNGDLVSLLLAATPPYLYNIPLVPQTFFFSEMLKSFVQAKTERQNLKTQQSHHRRQRKRSWREVSPPKHIDRDKPLELTTPKQAEEKLRMEKSPVKKSQNDGGDKKFSELGNFSVEKLANSSAGLEGSNSSSGDVLPPAPPLWYPLLYPPHPPYGIDPLHFFIDLRVSAHFWDRGTDPRTGHDATESPLVVSPGSAFRVPSPRKGEEGRITKERGKACRNMHYVISSLKDIYEIVERERKKEDAEGEEEKKWRKKKDLRAVIGLELVVDYVKQESDGEDVATSDPGQESS